MPNLFLKIFIGGPLSPKYHDDWYNGIPLDQGQLVVHITTGIGQPYQQ